MKDSLAQSCSHLAGCATTELSAARSFVRGTCHFLLEVVYFAVRDTYADVTLKSNLSDEEAYKAIQEFNHDIDLIYGAAYHGLEDLFLTTDDFGRSVVHSLASVSV